MRSRDLTSFYRTMRVMFRRRFSRSSHLSTFTTGNNGAADFRMFLTLGGTPRSFWHDIPLFATPQTLRYVNEIPRHTTAKFEVSLNDPGNPIKQDINKKDGSLRFFQAGPIPFNYGCAPQTWENPNKNDRLTGLLGDGDPIDLVELSDTPLPVGQVLKVKVLGIVGLIDQGETDWKVLTIQDGQEVIDWVKKVDQVLHWFRTYKIAEGKSENDFAFDGKVLSVAEALSIVNETHLEWKHNFDFSD